MKNKIKFLGFIAVMVIGFLFATCDDGSGGGTAQETAPAITTTTLPNGVAGTAYSQTLAATGTAPITWSLESGALPTGLALSGNGAISGTPATAATSNFTVKAANTKGSATKALSITVLPAGSSLGTAPTITTTTLPSGTVGTAYSQTLAATGTAPITWNLESGTLPAGLSLTSTTGAISGIPATVVTAATSTFTVKATNSAGVDTKQLSITIAPAGSGTPGLAYELIEDYEGSNAGTYRVSRGTVTSGSVIIPAIHNGLPVTEIAGGWQETAAFFGTNITSVDIPASVKIIGNYAFSCTGLTAITIPASVTHIGENAFRQSTNLTSVTFAAGSQLQTIGEGAFYYCPILTSITIPEGVTSISQQAFYECTGLTSITIPEGVTSIGNWAFSGCYSLETVTFAEDSQLTTIGGGAFYECALTSITIPASVTTIGSSAFYCENLRNIIIDNDIFWPNYSITTNGIWGSIFTADNLSVTFKKDVGDYAFYNSARLTSVTIEESVTSIGDRAFSGCTGLASITVAANNPNYASEDGFLYNKAKTTLIQSPAGITEVTIPATVTSISDWAFSHCANLRNITIDTDQVETTYTNNWATRFPADNLSLTFTKDVGDYAFYFASANSTKLASVTFTEGVTSIGNSAFYRCTGLTGITIPAGVTTIGNSAFYRCTGLTVITIPAGVTTIGSEAFRNCTDLTSVTIEEGITTTIGASAFRDCTSLSSVTIPASVTTIGTSAFSGCTGLSSITIPEGLITIGGSAFSGCTGLSSITIPASVTTIGNSAFQNITYLTSVTIGEGVTSIGPLTFNGCTYLKNIIIDNNVFETTSTSNWGTIFTASGLSGLSVTLRKNVRDNAFNLCTTSITSVTIANGVTSIGQSAFKDCRNITSVTLSNSLISIGREAFSGCYGLASVTIPASVTTISDYAFNNCTSLRGVTFQGTIPSASFGTNSPFPGALRGTYLASGGGIGTYYRSSSDTAWTKTY